MSLVWLRWPGDAARLLEEMDDLTKDDRYRSHVLGYPEFKYATHTS